MTRVDRLTYGCPGGKDVVQLKSLLRKVIELKVVSNIEIRFFDEFVLVSNKCGSSDFGLPLTRVIECRHMQVVVN